MERSTSFGDINLRPSSAVICKRTRTFHARDPSASGKGRLLSSPPPAQVMSDTTESSESTCDNKESSSPVLRRRGSSWSLTKEEKIPEKKRRAREESTQGSAVETTDMSSVPQHEAIEHAAGETGFSSMEPSKKDILLNSLMATSTRGKLTLINLSRRNLSIRDANLVKEAITQNPQLSVVKLSYNNFGDAGTATIASAIVSERGHHQCLSVLDLGFNNVGDDGCATLALHAVAGNFVLRTLYLAGNNIGEKGALSLAGAILHGSSLSCLHLTSNQIETVGMKALTRAVAESEARAQVAAQSADPANVGLAEPPTPVALPTVQELHIGGTRMHSAGLLSVANMMLTNFSLRVLCLSDNGIDDNDIALFSQSIGQNKSMPLEVLQLSFNKITCVGIECLMNAVWGSKTLREMKLDHNRLSDRGAQLAAVVLTSIDLEVLDVGYNRIGSLGVKALMKSLSENSSLVSLTLSGIPLDPPASKAVCYALAYNNSLRSFYVDSCSIGYSAQRHIVAGIVSNQHLQLRLFTGFRLGAITVTLGLPQALEKWSNDQVLRFVRTMWQRWRGHIRELKRAQQLQGIEYDGGIDEDHSLGTNPSSDGQRSETLSKTEPADPKTVVSASKYALSQIGDIGGGTLRTEQHQRDTVDTSPLVPLNATLLERTHSGTLRVPSLIEFCEDVKKFSTGYTKSGNTTSMEAHTLTGKSASPQSSLTGTVLNPLKRQKNTEWLRTNFSALNEISQLPFNENDFLQLQLYYYSLADGQSDASDSCDITEAHVEGTSGGNKSLNQNPLVIKQVESISTNGTEGRSGSERTVDMETAGRRRGPLSQRETTSIDNTSSKRHSREVNDEGDDESSVNEMEPAAKRAKSSEIRIARYPWVWEQLERCRANHSQGRALALMRQLRFVEVGIMQTRNKDAENVTVSDTEQPSYLDVEMILMSMAPHFFDS